jgi:Carboxypeptidase regulatory-like domain
MPHRSTSPHAALLKRIALVAGALVLATRALAAQAAAPAVVHVHVADSLNAPIVGAQVAVVDGLAKVVASAATNARGEVTLTVPSAHEYQLVARQIGYSRGSRFFTAAGEAMAITMQLSHVTPTLPGVSVTAQVDLKRQSYHIDADEIASSNRNILDGLDVLTKLRPYMVDSRPATEDNPCYIRDVYVNGRRILFADVNERLALDKRHKREAFVATIPINAGGARGINPNGIASIPVNVLSVLASIHPEHIEEINYADCTDISVPGTHTSSAVFVTLKLGVAFEPGAGSFVVPSGVALAPNRIRIVGVYDDESGTPLPGVEVADSASGAFVTTTETGTATLAFMGDGDHVIRLRRAGYLDRRFPVTISATDSLPLTLTLAKRH